MSDRPANRLGLALTRVLIATVSRPLPTLHYRALGLLGILDHVHASGWRIRTLSARYDLVWGNDVDFQERHMTVFLPDPSLFQDDELLALAISRLERVGLSVPRDKAISSALFRARARLRDEISRPA